MVPTREFQRESDGSMQRAGGLMRRAWDVWRTQGLVAVGRNGIRLARPWLFQWQRCYLYEHTVTRERSETDFAPRAANVRLEVVRGPAEAEALKSATGFDLRRRVVGAGRCLDRGAIAFCVFVNGEFAHIGWLALSEEAKSAFDSLPYRVAFADNQACTGGTETVPEFRSIGLMKYGYFKRFEFLREQGVAVSRNAVEVDNIASQKVHAKFGPRVYGDVRHLRLFRRTVYYRERPLDLRNGDLPPRKG